MRRMHVLTANQQVLACDHLATLTALVSLCEMSEERGEKEEHTNHEGDIFFAETLLTVHFLSLRVHFVRHTHQIRSTR
jgi:hypothetical protein